MWTLLVAVAAFVVGWVARGFASYIIRRADEAEQNGD